VFILKETVRIGRNTKPIKAECTAEWQT